MKVELKQIKPNFTRLDIGDVTVWFSYETPIGFHVAGEPKVLRSNVWGPTTGKHLNAICPDKDERINGTEFEELLSVALSNV